MNQWIEGVHYYVNEEGLVVLTEKYLLDRGYCCGNGCRHCPFCPERVPESKRKELTTRQPGTGLKKPGI